MIKEKVKKVLKILLPAISVIIVIKALTIIRPFNWHEISTPENAIIIAQAELIRRYGESEFIDMEFIVSEAYWPYWKVDEKKGEFSLRYGRYPQCVLVRKSNGRVIVLWRNNLRTRIIATLMGL